MSNIESLEERLPSEAKEQNSKGDVPLKERFFRYFQHEITALQEQMDRLADTSLVGGERSDATDHCLAGIARLSNEVKDASSYIPTYDQRIYAEAIKALQDKLAETRAAVAPRSKFSFKTKRNSNAVSLNDAAELAVQGRRQIPGYRSPDSSSGDSGLGSTPRYATTPVHEVEQQRLRPELAPTSSPAILDEGNKDQGKLEQSAASIYKPNDANATSVTVDQHYGLHVMAPPTSSPNPVPASITSLRHCVVDMSPRSTEETKPYASLTIKGVRESLLICGHVEGPAHITGVEHSVIVVACRQFRMHNCVDVDVYLSCTSNPIIEDCSGIRFGQIPKAYSLGQSFPAEADRWDKVEDFKWIKPEPSPNWKILHPSEEVPEEVWAEMVPGGPCWSLEDILRATKVTKE
ncbi:hypothetical protein VTN49DRAFT_5971 [Thermomyces lanuginosus]|uniref:uncharacterized protein n=1 Tax=Thermomyces lanuginosus TaxID=5541 RepID=UPI003742C6ED